MSELSAETSELVRILAAIDVLFSPWPIPVPTQSNKNCSGIFHAQQAYLRAEGIPWVVGGSAEVRRHGEKILNNLHKAELIVLPKSQGQHRFVGLTPRGDDTARQLVGGWLACEAWKLLRGMAEAVTDRRGVGPTGPGIWLTEGQLCEAVDGTADDLRAMVLPLLVRGYVSSFVSTDGEQFYTSTSEGKAVADGDRPTPQDTVAEDERCTSLYRTAYAHFSRARRKWCGPERDVFIPFPAR